MTAETLLAQWRRIHGVADRSGAVTRNDEKGEEVKKEVEEVVEKKDAQEAANFEEVPAWAAGLMQKIDSLHGRMDEIEAKTKGGVPEVEDGQDGYERTTVAKDAVGSPDESANNGEPAGRMFREVEQEEERGQAQYAGQNESPVTTSEEEQLRLQRSRGAAPEAREYNRDLEDGVDRMNTQGQERRDLRGHGEDKRDHHSEDRMDAMYRQQAAKIQELQAMVNRAFKQPTVEERNQVAAARKRADSIYSALARDTPEWLPGESPSAYRRRVADGLKEFSPKLKNTAMDWLPSDVFDLAEEQIYADALEATKRSDVVPPMQLRPHTYTDRGREITEYHGDPIAWMAPFMAAGAVSKIVKPAGNATH